MTIATPTDDAGSSGASDDMSVRIEGDAPIPVCVMIFLDISNGAIGDAVAIADDDCADWNVLISNNGCKDVDAAEADNDCAGVGGDDDELGEDDAATIAADEVMEPRDSAAGEDGHCMRVRETSRLTVA